MRRLIQIPLLLFTMLLVGAFGLRVLTGQPMLDCFYQGQLKAVIVLSQVVALSQEPKSSYCYTSPEVWVSSPTVAFSLVRRW